MNGDRDICFRIALHYRGFYIDEILAHYRQHPNAMSQDHDRMRGGSLKFVQKYQNNGVCGPFWVSEALGNLYREWGDDYFNMGELRRALGWYGKSICKYPFSLRNIYMFFRAVGEPVLAMVRTEQGMA